MGTGGVAVGARVEAVYRAGADYRRLAWIHRWHAVLVLALGASGILLYSGALRPLLAPVLVPLRQVHQWLGVAYAAFALATAKDWAPFSLRPGLHGGRRANVWLSAALLAGWTGTGAAMWAKAYLPVGWRAWTVGAHDLLTWLALPWIAAHIWFRWRKVRLALPRWWGGPAGRRLVRREVLWAGAAAFGAWAFYWGNREFGFLGRLWPAEASGAAGGAGDAAGRPPGSLPPEQLAGGGMQGRFRLYFVTSKVPVFDPGTWRLQVGGKVEQRLHLAWEELLARFPARTYVTNFHCVTGWSVFHVTWRGIPLAELLRAAVPAAGARYVKFHSGDGVYTDTLTLAQALDPTTFLAVAMEGAPVPRRQGGPLRLVVPKMYGYKSVKWVEAIELIDWEEDGFWEARGYPRDALFEHGEAACPGPGCGT